MEWGARGLSKSAGLARVAALGTYRAITARPRLTRPSPETATT